MVRRSNIVELLLIVLLLASLAGLVCAQTNAPAVPAPSWRWGPAPSLAPKSSTVKRGPPPSVSPDADLFFTKFKEAARLLRENHAQEAGIVLDGASKSLSTSPWMEIALLKHAELIESRNDTVAMEDYTVLRNRLDNAPYFQGDAEKARVFKAALQGAVDNGINRIRIRRIADSLARYHARYSAYPESLMKLSILGYVDIENIHAANDRFFRYLPTGQSLRPFISYQSYDLESVPPDPFTVNSPRLEATSVISETPPKYAAVIRVPGQSEATRVTEDQTIEGYFVAAVATGGAIVCTYNRVLVLATAE
jgi:hypothetical protein